MSPAAPSPVPVDIDTLRTVAHGAYYAPHDVLGPHVGGGGVTVRTLRPLAESVVVVTASSRVAARHEQDGIWVAVLPGTDVPDYRVEVTYDGDTTTVDDPYRFLPTVRRARPPPGPRGPARAAVDRPGRQRAHLPRRARRGQRHVVRRVGAQRPRRARRRRLQLLAGRAARHALPGRQRRLGALRPRRRGRAPGTSSRSSAATARGGRRPTRSRRAPRSRRRRPPSSSSPRYQWTDDAWLAARAAHDPHTAPMSVYEVHLGSWRRRARPTGTSPTS